MPSKWDENSSRGQKLLQMYIRLFMSGRKHFQTELAEALNCSKQTIIRLAQEIENISPTCFKTGMENRRRWYQYVPSSRRSMGLDSQELRYLKLCRELADPFLSKDAKDHLDKSIFRISLGMSELGGAEIHREKGVLFFSKGRIDYSPFYESIERLTYAIEHQKICHVTYCATGKKEARKHLFAPGHLVAMSGALYLMGAILNPVDLSIRHLTNLAVHHIREVAVTDRHIPVMLPDANAAMFGLPWHEPKTFRVRFVPGPVSDYVRERIWGEQQKMEELEDGGVLLTITTCSEPELMAWVRSFGDGAKLLS